MANEDRNYLTWLRMRRCCAPGPPHAGGEPHHPRHDEHGAVGMGLRAHDHRAISLCRACHLAIELHTGPFAGWTKERVREWVDDQAARLLRLYVALGESDFPM